MPELVRSGTLQGVLCDAGLDWVILLGATCASGACDELQRLLVAYDCHVMAPQAVASRMRCREALDTSPLTSRVCLWVRELVALGGFKAALVWGMHQ